MSEELQKPPVVDLDALLAPISEENPSGDNLRYSGIYDEINEARRADDAVSQGEWATELKAADYRKVIDLATDALSNKAKDIQIAAWFCESLTYQHGFAGLRDGLKLISALQDNFWDTMHPEIDEGDQEGRANAISWIDTQAAVAVKRLPIVQGSGYSFFDWEDAKRFSLPDNFDTIPSEEQDKYTEIVAQAEREGRVNGESWKKARNQTRRQFCEETNFIIEECFAELRELNRVNEEKYDRNQVPGINLLNKSLDAVHTQVKKILADKRLEEPDSSDDAGYENGEAGEVGENGTRSGGGGGGAVTGRADALKKLTEIAAYFQRTEPHSPVAYLVQRAVKWGNMPLDSWLQDVIKDENVLGSLRETLGVQSSGYYSSSSTDSGWEDSAAESAPEETTASSDDW